jgi:hypothetical protein
MTIAENIKTIEAALAEWATGNGGSVFVASDVVDLIERLRMKPGAPRVGILFVDEEPRGLDVLGRCDQGFKMVVSRGRSLKLQSGESLTEGAAGGKAMFDLVQEVKEVVLAIRLEPQDEEQLEEEDTIPTYKGSGQFEVNGLLLDAYEVRVGFAAQGTVQRLGGEG